MKAKVEGSEGKLHLHYDRPARGASRRCRSARCLSAASSECKIHIQTYRLHVVYNMHISIQSGANVYISDIYDVFVFFVFVIFLVIFLLYQTYMTSICISLQSRNYTHASGRRSSPTATQSTSNIISVCLRVCIVVMAGL